MEVVATFNDADAANNIPYEFGDRSEADELREVLRRLKKIKK